MKSIYVPGKYSDKKKPEITISNKKGKYVKIKTDYSKKLLTKK